MIKTNILSVLIVGLALFSLLSCQKNNTQKNEFTTKIIKPLNVVMSGNFDRKTAQQNFQILIDSLNNEVLPTVSGKDKDETNKIIQYFEGIKTNASDHLDNEDNFSIF